MVAQLTGTLGNYRQRMRNYLQEQNPATSFWPDPFLNQLFNVAYRRRCTQLHMAFEGYFTMIATTDLDPNSSGQSRYAWPTGFQRETKLEIVRSDGTTVPLERQERHFQYNPPANQSGAGDSYLPTFRPVGGGFVLEPPPNNQAVLGGLRIEFLGIPAELVADSDTMHPDFPMIFDELVVLDAVVGAFDSEGMMEVANNNMVRNLGRLRSEFELDWERWIDGRITATQGVQPFVTHWEDA